MVAHRPLVASCTSVGRHRRRASVVCEWTLSVCRALPLLRRVVRAEPWQGTPYGDNTKSRAARGPHTIAHDGQRRSSARTSSCKQTHTGHNAPCRQHRNARTIRTVHCSLAKGGRGSSSIAKNWHHPLRIVMIVLRDEVQAACTGMCRGVRLLRHARNGGARKSSTHCRVASSSPPSHTHRHTHHTGLGGGCLVTRPYCRLVCTGSQAAATSAMPRQQCPSHCCRRLRWPHRRARADCRCSTCGASE